MTKTTLLILLISILLKHNATGQNTLIIKNGKELEVVSKIDSIQQYNYISKIIQKLHSTGHINASVDSIKKSDSTTAYIYKGNQYKLNRFEVDFDFQTSHHFNFNKKKRLPFYANLQWIENQKTAIIKELENNGYPFASIETDFSTDSGFVDVYLKVNRGLLLRFDSIASNQIKLKNYFLERYLGIKPGDLYSEQKISEISERLNQLEYIKLEGTPMVTFGKKTARPELLLKPVSANQFNGLIGIVPDKNKSGRYNITGDIQLSLLNTLGRAEKVDMQWKKTETKSQQLNLLAEWPFMLNTPFGAEGQLSMLKQDTSFLSIDMKIGSFILFNGNNSASGYYSDKRTIVLKPKDTIETIATKSYGTGIGLKTYKLNNLLNPRTGYRINLTIEAGNRIADISETDDQKGWYWEAASTIQAFLPIYKQWTLGIQNISANKRSQHPYFKNELFRIGGMKTLRGFDENEFYSNLYTLNTIEIRWLFESNSHVKIFADQAFIQTKHENDRVNSRALGIGAGMNLHTNAGIFTISYALGKLNNDIIKLNNAKIHFGYINSF